MPNAAYQPSVPPESEREARIRRLSTCPQGEPRRGHPRFSAELSVDLVSEHNFYGGLTENLSVGGVFIATHLIKPVGEVLEVAIRLPGSIQVIRTSGEVRWVRVFNEHSDLPPGMGLRFLNLEPAASEAILSFLMQREPLLYDED